jgi:hypothetical protein
MPYLTQEVYKRITGMDMPKPWAERTEEEKTRAHDVFVASVTNSTPAEDEAIDEFIANIQKNLEESRSRGELREDEDAA